MLKGLLQALFSNSAAAPRSSPPLRPAVRQIGAGDLTGELARGDPDRDMGQFEAEDARFHEPAPLREHEFVYDPVNRPAALFVGVVAASVNDAESKRRADRYATGGVPVAIEDDRHIITVAGSRSGKGRSTIIPNMLNYRGSVLATDPKGELATETASRRGRPVEQAGLGQNVHVLDPFGVVTGDAVNYRKGFNPIAAMRFDKLIEDAALISDALVMVNDKDPHWDETARDFIEGVILHVKTAGRFQDSAHLGTVYALIQRGATVEGEPPSMKLLFAQMMQNGRADGAIAAAAQAMQDRPERERESVLSSARRHLKWLSLFQSKDQPLARRTIQDSDFSLAELKTVPTTIYMCLPAKHVGTCSRWLRLFVNLTLQAMEDLQQKPPGGIPVLFCLDEFAVLGRLKQLEDAAGQLAGFNVKLWPILQDLGQLKALYSDRWETFMGNAGVLQFFGNNDLTTLEWISKRLGKTEIVTVGQSSLTPGQVHREGGSGKNWTPRSVDLMAPQEVGSTFRRADPLMRQLVYWTDWKRPLILQRAYHDKHELFRNIPRQQP